MIKQNFIKCSGRYILSNDSYYSNYMGKNKKVVKIDRLKIRIQESIPKPKKKIGVKKNYQKYKNRLKKVWQAHIENTSKVNVLKYLVITRQKTEQLNEILGCKNSDFQKVSNIKLGGQDNNKSYKQRQSIKKSLRLITCRTTLKVIGPSKYKEQIKTVTSTKNLICIVMSKIIEKLLTGVQTNFEELKSLQKMISELKSLKLNKKLSQWLTLQQKKEINELTLNSRLSFIFLCFQDIKYRCSIALSFCQLFKQIKQKTQHQKKELQSFDCPLNLEQIIHQLIGILQNQDRLNDKMAKIISLYDLFQCSIINLLVNLPNSYNFYDIFSQKLKQLTKFTHQNQFQLQTFLKNQQTLPNQEDCPSPNIFDFLNLENSQTWLGIKNSEQNEQSLLEIYHRYGLIDQNGLIN